MHWYYNYNFCFWLLDFMMNIKHASAFVPLGNESAMCFLLCCWGKYLFCMVKCYEHYTFVSPCISCIFVWVSHVRWSFSCLMQHGQCSRFHSNVLFVHLSLECRMLLPLASSVMFTTCYIFSSYSLLSFLGVYIINFLFFFIEYARLFGLLWQSLCRGQCIKTTKLSV